MGVHEHNPSAAIIFDGRTPVRREILDELFNPKYRSLTWSFNALYSNQAFLLDSYTYYSRELKKINPSSFYFMNEEQRKNLNEWLISAFCVFSAQYQLDKKTIGEEIEESKHQRPDLSSQFLQIKRCDDLLCRLDDYNCKNVQKDKESLDDVHKKNLAHQAQDPAQPVRYYALRVIAPFIAEKIEQTTTGQSMVLKQWIGEINDPRRLYWIGACSFFGSILTLLPDTFAHKAQTKQVLSAPAPYMGYLSWILYYVRFGVELNLLFRHTFKGPWMSAEEKALNISTWDRFKTQWQQRKFLLLNDLIWATANLVCFFWLVGRPLLDYSNNILTVGLLLMDVGLATWQYLEEQTKFNADMARYTNEIEALKQKINKEKLNDLKLQLQTTLESDQARKKSLTQAIEDEKEEQLRLGRQWEILRHAQKKCQTDWKFKKYGLVKDLTYAVSLAVSYSMMTCFLFPPGLMPMATGLILGAVGGALYFVLGITAAAVTAHLETRQLKASHRDTLEDCKNVLQKFIGCDDKDTKKQLYLDYQLLLVESHHQKKMIAFQKVKLARSVLIDAMVPSLVFISFLFGPLSLGFSILAVGVVISMLSKMLQQRLEPKRVKVPEFNEDEYNAFNPGKELRQLNSQLKTSQVGLFAKPRNNDDPPGLPAPDIGKP